MKTISDRTPMMMEEFQKIYHTAPTHVAIAPGRVNLIGEHTDYNDGFVLPVALTRDVRFVVRPRPDRKVRIASLEFGDTARFDLDAIVYDEHTLWINYVQGVALMLEAEGLRLTGMDAVLSGNVPRGSGLSSSAALEVAAAKAFMAVSGQLDALDGPTVALVAQRAENEFVGVNCGIMDQFISVLGRAGHALLIDCRSLDYELTPFPADASLVIGNTKASRSLASSAYNERRQECETGVELLRPYLPGITALRDVTSDALEANKDHLPETIYRRCRHVVSENERVLAMADALGRGDLSAAGRLMDASHASLRDDYEVSSPALDAMVEAMHRAPGCYGARLTGAGFGGCAVALVRPGREQAVADAIYQHYPKATNIWPDVYATPAADGARVLELS